MPELPEVETIKRGLEKRVIGQKIANVEVKVKKLFIGDAKDLAGAKIVKIWRRGKILGIDLEKVRSDDLDPVRLSLRAGSSQAQDDKKVKAQDDNRMKTLLIHLKMTGQLVFQGSDEKIKVVGGHPQKSYNEPLPHKHTHIIIYFLDGSRLYFNDMRKFGWMKLLKTSKVEEDKFLSELGVEPFEKEFKSSLRSRKMNSDSVNDEQISNLKMTIQKSRLSIKIFLINQKYIAGIGNIYSDEVLYMSGIRPDRKSCDLSNGEIDEILKNIPVILDRAIKCGGSSDNTFRGVEGEKGTYLDCASVYHKKIDPKGHEISRKKIGGRTAHFCRQCQK